MPSAFYVNEKTRKIRDDLKSFDNYFKQVQKTDKHRKHNTRKARAEIISILNHATSILRELNGD